MADMKRLEGPCRWVQAERTGDWSWWDEQTGALEREWEAYQRTLSYRLGMIIATIWEPYEKLGLWLWERWAHVRGR